MVNSKTGEKPKKQKMNTFVKTQFYTFSFPKLTFCFTLDIFRTMSFCFHYSIWTGKYWLERLFSYLKSDSHLPEQLFFICFNDSPSKIMRKCFLFHHKTSFRSQDISIFVFTFWASRKNGLIRKKMLISKLMTSQPG